MNTHTHDYLVDMLESQMTVKNYKRHGQWYLKHIDKLATNYPFLEIDAEIKVTIDGEEIECIVVDFILNWDEGILVDTGYGNVYYHETKKL